jgi:hypothetical protein
MPIQCKGIKSFYRFIFFSENMQSNRIPFIWEKYWIRVGKNEKNYCLFLHFKAKKHDLSEKKIRLPRAVAVVKRNMCHAYSLSLKC